MRTLEFFAPCIPPTVTNQQHRFRQINGRVVSYRTKRQNEAIAILKNAFYPFVPDSPFEGPISFNLSVRYPFRVSEPEKRRKYGLLPKQTRPDSDNICKEIQDVMSSMGFWKDDAQIFDLHVTKYWANKPGIKVEIKQFTA